MKNVYPYITNDGSVGLYSSEFDDIYHSTYGAYAEGWEKFILPSDIEYYITNFKKINVLDICYGIGYNTKSFLQKCYNETIYSDNILPNFYIKAVDMDEELIFLSPFFTCNAKRKPKNQNLPTEKVKHLSSVKVEKQYNYDNTINYILIKNMAQKFPDFLKSDFLHSCLTKKGMWSFFSKPSILFYVILSKLGVLDSLICNLYSFVHNIYYRHISTRYKTTSKAPRMADFEVDFQIGDARAVISEDTNIYQLIFLDAFTPTKCPCLWTLDFFKCLYSHLDENGRILTYSNSSQIRNAFLNAGFYVGKIYNERTGTFTGTIAVKNKSFIKHELSEYDLSLMKTRAGIFYRDEKLNALNEAITTRHKKEVDESPLITSSKFIKQYRKEHNNV